MGETVTDTAKVQTTAKKYNYPHAFSSKQFRNVANKHTLLYRQLYSFAELEDWRLHSPAIEVASHGCSTPPEAL